MLARYLLSSCVRLSVCHKSVSCRNDWTNRAGLAWRLPFIYPTLCLIRKFSSSGISKNKGTSLWNFVPNYGLRKFCHGKSIAFSTKLVVVVDGRDCWRHLYDSRRVVAVYCKSVNCNPLTPLLWFVVDLSWICCKKYPNLKHQLQPSRTHTQSDITYRWQCCYQKNSVYRMLFRDIY